MRPAQDGDGVEPGTVIAGKYRVDAILGKGGMGMVYRALHLALGEDVAIKVLRRDASRDEDAVHRFMREAQAAVKLRSEHVARVTDVGTVDDLPYIVMEFLEGADLGQMVDTHGAMSVPVAVDLVLQACDAIAEAHALGIVHRDLKPTNLFVSFRPDQSAIVKVLDFGISKSANGSDLSLTQTQSVLGTPAYMSPEQMRSARTVDVRTDIWSIGTVLYELVEANLPFEAESFSEMCVKVAMDPPRPMQLAPELAPLLARCLAKQPSERFANVAELMHELSAFAGNPDAARQLVTRASRVLGRAVPPPRASSPAVANLANGRYTPLPGPSQTAVRDAASAAVSSIATPLGVATTMQDPPKPASTRSMVIAGLAFIALGVGGALIYVKATSEPAPSAATTEPGERVVPMPKPGQPSEAPSVATTPVDAGVADAAIATTVDAAATDVAAQAIDAGAKLNAGDVAVKPAGARPKPASAGDKPSGEKPAGARPKPASAGDKPAAGEKSGEKPGEKPATVPFDPFAAPRPTKKG